MIKSKLLVILGPTATGKSDLAVFLAQKFNAEVISADSRQVYRGLDLGTGKITREEMRGIRHYLLDIADPSEQFSVAQYQELATATITEIQSRGKLPRSRSKLPILCGGTGQYIRVVTRGSKLPAVAPNVGLREELETWETEDLAAELERLDPDRHEAIDRNNRRRLIRAIEIVKVLGKVPLLQESDKYQTFFVGLTLDSKTLHQRIHGRLLARLEQGLTEEVAALERSGVSWKRLESFGLEYKYCAQFLQKILTQEQMIQKLESEIWHYAKRQMTYFKKYFPETQWFQPTEREEILGVVAHWLKH